MAMPSACSGPRSPRERETLVAYARTSGDRGLRIGSAGTGARATGTRTGTGIGIGSGTGIGICIGRRHRRQIAGIGIGRGSGIARRACRPSTSPSVAHLVELPTPSKAAVAPSLVMIREDR